MPSPVVALIDRTSPGLISDMQVHALARALQFQVSVDFHPVWCRDAVVVTVARGADPPPGSWWLVLLDDTDASRALGYHDLTSEGLPSSRVFVRTTKADGGIWTVTASHELLEMLVDPDINLCVQVESPDGPQLVYALEVCDPCESDACAYGIAVESFPMPDGSIVPACNMLVSDFVTPAWFDANSANIFRDADSGRFDFMGRIGKSLEILPDGYIGAIVGGRWAQLTPDDAPHHGASRRYAGNRWHRRKSRHVGFTRSDCHKGEAK